MALQVHMPSDRTYLNWQEYKGGKISEVLQIEIEQIRSKIQISNFIARHGFAPIAFAGEYPPNASCSDHDSGAAAIFKESKSVFVPLFAMPMLSASVKASEVSLT